MSLATWIFVATGLGVALSLTLWEIRKSWGAGRKTEGKDLAEPTEPWEIPTIDGGGGL